VKGLTPNPSPKGEGSRMKNNSFTFKLRRDLNEKIIKFKI